MMIHSFNTKEEIEQYILDLCKDYEGTIIVRGSTAHGNFDEFSDWDIEVFSETSFKPIYKFAFVDGKVVLISILHMGEANGEEVAPPQEIKILKGNYCSNMNDAPFDEGNKDDYGPGEWVTRKRQVIVDEMFKYLRHRDEKTLELIEQKLNF